VRAVRTPSWTHARTVFSVSSSRPAAMTGRTGSAADSSWRTTWLSVRRRGSSAAKVLATASICSTRENNADTRPCSTSTGMAAPSTLRPANYYRIIA